MNYTWFKAITIREPCFITRHLWEAPYVKLKKKKAQNKVKWANSLSSVCPL